MDVRDQLSSSRLGRGCWAELFGRLVHWKPSPFSLLLCNLNGLVEDQLIFMRSLLHDVLIACVFGICVALFGGILLIK